MSGFQPRDPSYADRVTAAFQGQTGTGGQEGELVSVTPGNVEITLSLTGEQIAAPVSARRSIVATLLDDACILAALSLTSAGDSVAMIEYKVNFVDSGISESIVARAEVLRPGRSITVCRADAVADGRLTARMLATLAVSR